MMVAFLWVWILETWRVVAEAAPWLLAGFLVAGVIHAWVPVSKIAQHLGQPSLGGVLKAAVLGAPLPLCSCSVIPVASSIRRSGASRGAVTAFLISTPETGVDSIAITYALLGPFMAVLRPLAAIVTAIVAGLLVNRFDSDRGAKVGSPAACGCARECGSSVASGGAGNVARQGLATRFAKAFRYGFVEMFADLSAWLILGFLLAGLISASVPAGLFTPYLGSRVLAMVLVLAIALPMYVCASASTPVAAALIAKGMSLGTALVFLLAGPATNVATIAVVAKELGRRGLVIYLASIGVVSVALGLLVDWLLVLPVVAAMHVGDVHEAVTSWHVAAAAVLVLLLLNGLRMRYGRTASRDEVL